MSVYAMPLLIVNLGGEMVYILEQRLQAQNISTQKSKRVLQDVVKTMLSTTFVAQLFEADEMYSFDSVRGVFDRLAHSSIMRLSDNSMSKLYDLMTMSFKYQVISCSCPNDVLKVTMNHLKNIREIVDHSAVAEMVDNVTTQCRDLYEKMTFGEFQILRDTLLHFFQDRRVKVSLFLASGLQTQDGAIVIPRGGPTPPDTHVPGIVWYYDAGKVVEETTWPSTNMSTAYIGPPERPCNLGENLYLKSKSGSGSSAAKSDAKAKSKGKSKGKSKSAGGPADAPNVASNSAAASAQASLLANLIGPSDDVNAEDEFSVTLFADGPTAGGSMTEDGEQMIFFETDVLATKEALIARNPELAAIMGEMDFGSVEGGSGGGGGDGGGGSGGGVDNSDLLDMMDDF